MYFKSEFLLDIRNLTLNGFLFVWKGNKKGKHVNMASLNLDLRGQHLSQFINIHLSAVIWLYDFK